MCPQSHWLMQLLRVYSASYYSSVCVVLEVDVHYAMQMKILFFISPRKAFNCKGLDASQQRYKRLCKSVQG